MGKDWSAGAQRLNDRGLKIAVQLLRSVKLEIVHISATKNKTMHDEEGSAPRVNELGRLAHC
jgi:hypothetical protein